MENEIIGIARAPNSTRDINERIAITELLETAASWMGMVACWWTMMLMQGGIFFTTLETKDCLFLIVIFLFICFRHRLYFSPQATWALTEANRSLWANNIQQLALPIGFISRLLYWCKLVSAIICAVLSMMRLVSQDFGQTKGEKKELIIFALNVFYVLALIETVLLLVALVLQMLFEQAKEEKKEQKKEEKEDEKKEVMKHETIEIPDQTNTCSEQQDSSDPMPNNNGDDTWHKWTGKIEKRTFALLLMLATILRVLVFGYVASALLLLLDGIVFTLETKHCMFITVILFFLSIRFLYFCLQTIRSMLANNIQQMALPIDFNNSSPLFYRFQHVSAWTCVVLSMMGHVSLVTKMAKQELLLHPFYNLTFLEALMSLAIVTLQRTVTEAPFEGTTDQSNNFLPNRWTELIKAPSEYPAEKCKETEEKKAETKKSQ